MSEYSRRLIALQDALIAGWITQRDYETGVAQVRRDEGRIGWGAGENV